MRTIAPSHRLVFWPSTRLGWWAEILLGAFTGFMVLLMAFVAAGQRGGDTFFDNLWLGISGLAAGLSGIGSFVVGVLALVRSHERAVTVMLSTLITALVTVFLIGEVAVPH